MIEQIFLDNQYIEARCGLLDAYIKCVKNALDSTFIYSNIDTWGVDTKRISAFVLAKVVDDVADYVDMSAFKSLPSQYIEALKLGNNTSKLLAIFSTVSNDPENGLKKLNKVLGAINVTTQHLHHTFKHE